MFSAAYLAVTIVVMSSVPEHSLDDAVLYGMYGIVMDSAVMTVDYSRIGFVLLAVHLPSSIDSVVE